MNILEVKTFIYLDLLWDETSYNINDSSLSIGFSQEPPNLSGCEVKERARPKIHTWIEYGGSSFLSAMKRDEYA